MAIFQNQNCNRTPPPPRGSRATHPHEEFSKKAPSTPKKSLVTYFFLQWYNDGLSQYNQKFSLICNRMLHLCKIVQGEITKNQFLNNPKPFIKNLIFEKCQRHEYSSIYIPSLIWNSDSKFEHSKRLFVTSRFF